LTLKEEGQEYAQATKMLGNGRVEVVCFDGVKRMATIRGKMRKKVWVNVGDIVLLGLRDFQDAKADVILKYMPDEARQLQKQGEIPESAKINEENAEGGQGWEFDDDGGDDDSSSGDDAPKPAAAADTKGSDSDDDVDVDNI